MTDTYDELAAEVTDFEGPIHARPLSAGTPYSSSEGSSNGTSVNAVGSRDPSRCCRHVFTLSGENDTDVICSRRPSSCFGIDWSAPNRSSAPYTAFETASLASLLTRVRAMRPGARVRVRV
jgi:hypothetical protein